MGGTRRGSVSHNTPPPLDRVIATNVKSIDRNLFGFLGCDWLTSARGKAHALDVTDIMINRIKKRNEDPEIIEVRGDSEEACTLLWMEKNDPVWLFNFKRLGLNLISI